MMDTPNIRFKGYTEPWEQRKLENVTEEFKSGSFIAADDIEEKGEYPVYGGNGLRGYASIYNHDGEFALIGRQGALCGNMNYCVGKAYFTEHAVAVKANNSSNTRFLYYLLDKMNLGQYSDQSAQPGLAVGKLIKLENMFPSRQEQEKIGTHFKYLDNLITLHQRKCDEISKLKKFMLQKMFPKNGELFPEIRFSGFTGSWEQRKLGDIANKVTTKNSDIQYIETLTNSAEYGIISQRDYFDHDVSNMENIDGYYVVENDAFVYNPRISTSAPVGPINRNKLGRTGVMSPLYTVFKTKDIDLEYLDWFFKSTRWHIYMKLNGDSGARSDRFSIKDSVFFKMPIPIPYIDEQKIIGKYMSNIDNLIILHQRKYKELKDIKKFMLQNMFPQKG